MIMQVELPPAPEETGDVTEETIPGLEMEAGVERLDLKLDPRIDLNTSWILLDGQMVELTDYTLHLNPAGGSHELSWSLLDSQGSLVEADTRLIEIEALPLKLQVLLNGQQLEEWNVFCAGSLECFANMDVQWKVTADGELLEEPFELEQPVELLEVQAADEQGRQSTAVFHFAALPAYEAAVLKEEQVLACNGLLQLHFCGSLEGYQLSDGTSLQPEMEIQVDQEGQSQLKIFHEKAGYVGSIPVWNVVAAPSLEITQNYSPASGTIQIATQAKDYTSLQIQLIHEDNAKLISSDYSFRADTQNAASYEVVAEMVDVFGQSHTQSLLFETDNRQPAAKMQINGTTLQSGGVLEYAAVSSAEFSHNGDTLQARFLLDGQVIEQQDLLKLLQSASPGQKLQVFYEVQLSSGRSSRYDYTFVYTPLSAEAWNPVTEEAMDLGFSLRPDGQIDMIWRSPDEQDRLHISEQYEEVQPNSLLTSDSVRIWLDTSGDILEFSGLYINGEEIEESQIQKDKLDQPYVDIPLEEGTYQIDVEAVDEEGNIIRKSTTLEARPENKTTRSWWLIPLFLMAGLLGLRPFLKKKRA